MYIIANNELLWSADCISDVNGLARVDVYLLVVYEDQCIYI